MKEILVNGQWQGGADLVTFDGAKEITKKYLAGLDHVILPVSTDKKEMEDFPNTPLPVDNGLFGEEVYNILTAVSGRLAGMGIYEYAPSGARNDLVEKLIQFGAAL